MGRRSGIPLIDLFELHDRLAGALPPDVEAFYNRFVVTGHSVRHAGDRVFHHGVLEPIAAEVTEIPTAFTIGIGTLSLPLLQSGIPFQLAFDRAPLTGIQNLEPNATAWWLDLLLDDFTLTLDGLEPAIFVKDAGTVPRHLLRDPTRDKVRITGSSTLRLQRSVANPAVALSFIDKPDPFDPAVPSGAVATLTCSPPHFFIGGSEFGLTVGQLTFDFSDSYSPPDVIARNQGPGWVGVAIREGTSYAPRNLPTLGDLSGGVKNVLIGSPVGLQGELEIQFGRTPLDPTSFAFIQVTSGADLSIAPTGGDTAFTLAIQASQGVAVTIRASLPASGPPSGGGSLVNWKARWSWPDGSADEGDASSGAVRHGQVLRVTPVEIVEIDGEESEFAHPEVTFRFVASGVGPTINATIGSQRFVNVTHLGAIAAEIGTATLTAVSASASSFEWWIDGQAARTPGPSFTPNVADLAGEQMVVLREIVTVAGVEESRYARLRLQLREDREFLVGCQAGVFAADDATNPRALAAVEDTFDLSDFHAEGAFNARSEQATLNPEKTGVIVPADGLARVTVAGVAPPASDDRHVQVLMDFDTDNELRWGAHQPAGSPGSGAFSQSDLLAWATRYAGAEFIIVGRRSQRADRLGQPHADGRLGLRARIAVGRDADGRHRHGRPRRGTRRGDCLRDDGSRRRHAADRQRLEGRADVGCLRDGDALDRGSGARHTGACRHRLCLHAAHRCRRARAQDDARESAEDPLQECRHRVRHLADRLGPLRPRL
ncbi:MAG: hypothetical protein ACREWG_12515 [Gammaproteobacteria bacterium]